MNDEAVILVFSNFFLSILFILVVLILKCNQRDLWINNKLLILKRKVDASGQKTIKFKKNNCLLNSNSVKN